MKKITNVLVNILIILSVIVWGSIWAEHQCREAYSNGYYAGHGTKVCTLGFIYRPNNPKGSKFKWVGEGNEEYTETVEAITRRGKKYWWAK